MDVDNKPVPPPDALSLAQGAVFHDQYEVVRRIDSGAMGTVYEVLDRRTKRRRALKVMLARFVDNTEVTERFRREATITADILSEHVVETFDAGVDAETGLPFLVMELLRGEDLGKVVTRGSLPPVEVVTLLMQAASALDKMHGAGIVHRDLKPENIYLTRRDDGAPRIKILDFGIAKVIEKAAAPSATSTRNMGTPVYMSPEQVMGSGDVGPPADLYAVGHLAFAMLTGEPYWLEDALAYETVYPLLLRIMDGASEPASARAARNRKITLSPSFDEWFAKATAHAPEERFETATTSILALADALDVARPVLPTWPMEQAIGDAPTLSPPEDESAPIPLIPPPSAVPKAEEALRTLSPVSTLPEELQKSSPAGRERARARLLFGLGAGFFAAGVVAAILIVRTVARDERDGFAHASTVGPPAPVATATAPSTAAPSTTVAPVGPNASDASPVSSGASAIRSAPEPSVTPVTTVTPSEPPAAPTKKASKPPRSRTGKTPTTPPRAYGDPSRDL